LRIDSLLVATASSGLNAKGAGSVEARRHSDTPTPTGLELDGDPVITMAIQVITMAIQVITMI
jgi:hypothetical protein